MYFNIKNSTSWWIFILYKNDVLLLLLF